METKLLRGNSDGWLREGSKMWDTIGEFSEAREKAERSTWLMMGSVRTVETKFPKTRSGK